MLQAQRLADQAAEPEEERQVGVAEIVRQVAEGDDQRLLDHVGGVDAALEAAVEPQRHQAPEAVAVGLDQLGPGGRVALGGPAEPGDLAGRAFGCLHEGYLARAGRSVTGGRDFLPPAGRRSPFPRPNRAAQAARLHAKSLLRRGGARIGPSHRMTGEVSRVYPALRDSACDSEPDAGGRRVRLQGTSMHSNGPAPLAGSIDLLFKSVELLTGIVFIDPSDDLVTAQFPVGLDDNALAVGPLQLDRVEPPDLRRQESGGDPHARRGFLVPMPTRLSGAASGPTHAPLPDPGDGCRKLSTQGCQAGPPPDGPAGGCKPALHRQQAIGQVA